MLSNINHQNQSPLEKTPNITFFLFNILSGPEILKVRLINKFLYTQIISQIKHSINYLFHDVTHKELNLLYFLYKQTILHRTPQETLHLNNLKIKYKAIKKQHLPIIKYAIKNNIPVNYDTVLKSIKIVLSNNIHSNHNYTFQKVLPFILKMFEVLQNPLTPYQVSEIQRQVFFKTIKNEVISESANKSCLNHVISPWPESSNPQPHNLIKHLKLDSIKLMNYNKLVKWCVILKSNSIFTESLKKPYDQFLLSQNKLDAFIKIYDNTPKNYFIAFHNVIQALLFISQEKLYLSYRQSFALISKLQQEILNHLIWRRKLAYTIIDTGQTRSRTLNNISRDWGSINNYFNCSSAASVIIILCYQHAIKNNIYSKEVLENDLNKIQKILLEETTNEKARKNKITQEKLILFFVKNFPTKYKQILEQDDIYENKLSKRINQKGMNIIKDEIINQFYNSKLSPIKKSFSLKQKEKTQIKTEKDEMELELKEKEEEKSQNQVQTQNQEIFEYIYTYV